VVRGRVMRVRQGERDPVDVDGAALVRVADVLQLVLDLQPVGELNRGDDGGAVLLRELDGVAEMVAVCMREGDDVDALPRLLAPGIALAALLADACGVHGLAAWLVLLALPAAAAAAFVGVSDALEGLGAMRAAIASLALALLVLGSAVREGAPRGGSVPAL